MKYTISSNTGLLCLTAAQYLFLLKLSVEARKEMTRKAIQTVQHFIEKPRKRSSEDNIQEASDPNITYADVRDQLEKSLAHLETLNHTFLVSLRNSEQVMKPKLPHARSLRSPQRMLTFVL